MLPSSWFTGSLVERIVAVALGLAVAVFAATSVVHAFNSAAERAAAEISAAAHG